MNSFRRYVLPHSQNLHTRTNVRKIKTTDVFQKYFVPRNSGLEASINKRLKYSPTEEVFLHTLIYLQVSLPPWHLVSLVGAVDRSKHSTVLLKKIKFQLKRSKLECIPQDTRHTGNNTEETNAELRRKTSISIYLHPSNI